MNIKQEQIPFLQQYNNLKERHPVAILLFRNGDFYETYKEDAVTTARILGITLSRLNATDIDMAGFPCHALDTYLSKLIRKGCRVAICDRLDNTKRARK